MLTDTNTVLVHLNVYVFYEYLAYLISYNKANYEGKSIRGTL